MNTSVNSFNHFVIGTLIALLLGSGATLAQNSRPASSDPTSQTPPSGSELGNYRNP